MDALVARLRLLVLLAGQAGAVAWLHGLGGPLAIDWADPAGWVAAAAPADALVAAVRFVALAVGWWLLASTAGYALVSLARLPGAAAAVARATLPTCRRAVDRALAGGGATAVLLAGPLPALGEVVVPPPVVAPVEVEGPAPLGDADPGAGTAEADVAPPPFVVPPHARADAAPRAPAAAGESVHVVEPGDHLWGVAASTLAEASGRDPCALAAGEIAPYWRRLVEANRDHLRSGDPDLIHPGERLRLPPPAAP